MLTPILFLTDGDVLFSNYVSPFSPSLSSNREIQWSVDLSAAELQGLPDVTKRRNNFGSYNDTYTDQQLAEAFKRFQNKIKVMVQDGQGVFFIPTPSFTQIITFIILHLQLERHLLLWNKSESLANLISVLIDVFLLILAHTQVKVTPKLQKICPYRIHQLLSRNLR